MEQTQIEAVQTIINQVVQTVAIIAPFAALGTSGIVEFLKKAGLPSKFAGLAAYVFGFGISIVMMGLIQGTYFSALSILIGVIVAFGTPGIYSGIKALAPKKEVVV